MNICECGCGQECGSRFLRGHNKRTGQDKSKEGIEKLLTLLSDMKTIKSTETALAEPEIDFDYKENYTLTNVSNSVILNYEAGKRWLDKTFVRYTVRINHNEEELPCEIILSAANFEKNNEGTWLIGTGSSFSNALKEILINV